MAVVGTSGTPAVRVRTRRRSGLLRRSRYGEHPLLPYLFILPHLTFFFIFVLFSTVLGFYISLNHFKFLPPTHYWIGLRNYQHLLFVPGNVFHDDFFTAFKNTCVFVLMSVPANIVLGMLLANLLNARLPGRKFFRALYLFPSIISVTVVALLWANLFGDPNQGAINLILRSLNLPQVSFHTSTTWAWPLITIAALWSGTGWTAIILVAGLQTIPTHLYEAAQIDGAGPLARFFHVTIPGVRPVLLFILITSMLGGFNQYVLPLLITAGGPGDATQTVVMRIVHAGWDLDTMGMAAAESFVFGAFLALLSIISFRLLYTERS